MLFVEAFNTHAGRKVLEDGPLNCVEDARERFRNRMTTTDLAMSFVFKPLSAVRTSCHSALVPGPPDPESRGVLHQGSALRVTSQERFEMAGRELRASGAGIFRVLCSRVSMSKVGPEISCSMNK
jgi:hypothetical protein